MRDRVQGAAAWPLSPGRAGKHSPITPCCRAAPHPGTPAPHLLPLQPQHVLLLLRLPQRQQPCHALQARQHLRLPPQGQRPAGVCHQALGEAGHPQEHVLPLPLLLQQLCQQGEQALLRKYRPRMLPATGRGAGQGSRAGWRGEGSTPSGPHSMHAGLLALLVDPSGQRASTA